MYFFGGGIGVGLGIFFILKIWEEYFDWIMMLFSVVLLFKVCEWSEI